MKPAAALALAFLLAAASLGRYRGWAESPQGWFMTAAERAAWAKITTEAEAEQFVAKFLAARGPSFAADVARAAKEADEHLTVNGRPGSKTLRGKIAILLGPPAKLVISQWLPPKDTSRISHAAPWRPQVNPAPADSPRVSDMRKRYTDDYTFTYAKEKLPPGATRDLTIVVSVNPANGDDRILDAHAAREVNELLEAAAAARLSKQ